MKFDRNDIMFDLETLGIKNDSVITQIGACYFNRYTGSIGKELKINISIDSCLRAGLKVTGGAIEFWMNRKATWLEDTMELNDALCSFAGFINPDLPLWSHVSFDPVILGSAYTAQYKPIPWKYDKILDIRTLLYLTGIYKDKDEPDEKSHDALEDCKYQVDYCTMCFNKLRYNEEIT